MRFVVLDLETTGIPDTDAPLEELQILEFGAVIEDTNNPLAFDDIPKYNRIIAHEKLTGGVFALNMNRRIVEILAKRPKRKYHEQRQAYDQQYGIIEMKDLARDFFDFLHPHFREVKTVGDRAEAFEVALHNKDKYGKGPIYITPAGKNFDAFDRGFIENKIPKWSNYIEMGHRTIDPTTPFIDWHNDEQPPGLGKCMERAGVYTQVTHRADQDCWDTLQCLRQLYKIDAPWNVLKQ